MENIDNCFASILVFYENFKRSKLTPTDLEKIAKKYRSKPNQLILDLEKKYHLPIPTQVCSLMVVRICVQYGVPPAYMALLPANIQSAVSTYDYDATLDVRSDTFDAEKVLQVRRIINPEQCSDRLDNLSKFKGIVLTKNTSSLTKKSSNDDGGNGPRERTVIAQPAKIKHTYVHVFERIAADSANTHPDALKNRGNRGHGQSNSSSSSSSSSSSAVPSLQESPFALAYKLMTDRAMVRVVIRRYASVHGVVTGFLRAFDAHFNLLLTDVDEEYNNRNRFTTQSEQLSSQHQQYFSRHENRNDGSSASASASANVRTSSGSSSSSSSDTVRSKVRILKRHLPQLLIRGDNVISLSRRTLQVCHPPIARLLMYNTSDVIELPIISLFPDQSCSYGKLREMLRGVNRSTVAPREDTSVNKEQQQRQMLSQHRPPPPPPLPPTYMHHLQQQQHQQYQQQQQQQQQKRQLEEQGEGEEEIDWRKMNEESDEDVNRYFET